MHSSRLFSTLALGFLACSSSSAQVVRMPELTAALTSRDVSTKPPILSLYSAISPAMGSEIGQVQFECRGGVLVLTQVFGGSTVVTPGSILDASNTKILWSGTFGTEPIRFTFAAGEGDEQLTDSTGKVIWSQATSEQASATIAAVRYNAGLVVPFSLTKETGSSIDIADKGHHLLKTVPSMSLRLTVLTAEQKFPDYAPSPYSARNTFIVLPSIARTQALPLAPGRLYVTYHTAEGNWTAAQLVRAVRVRMPPALNRPDILEVNAENLNEVGTPETNPSIEYNWSQPLQNMNANVSTL